MFEASLRRTAWILTLAGLVPFICCTLAIIFDKSFFGYDAITLFLSYGAIILSFLGGIVWMAAIQLKGDFQLSRWLLYLSVCPSILGWVALVIQGREGLIFLIAGFSGWMVVENSLTRMEIYPAWFWKLRQRTSSAVIALLAVVVFSLYST
jgi:Protein of unknown function (DUF3429)